MSGTPTHDHTQRTPPEARGVAPVVPHVVSSLGRVASTQIGNLTKNSPSVTSRLSSYGRDPAPPRTRPLGCPPIPATHFATLPPPPPPPPAPAGTARWTTPLGPGYPAPLRPIGESDTRLADPHLRPRSLHTQPPTPHQDVGTGPWPPTLRPRSVTNLARPESAGPGTPPTMPSGHTPPGNPRSRCVDRSSRRLRPTVSVSATAETVVPHGPRGPPTHRPLSARALPGPRSAREALGPWPHPAGQPRSYDLS